jgi:hypothetical protein
MRRTGSAEIIVNRLKMATSTDYASYGITLIDISDVPPPTSSSTFTQSDASITQPDQIITNRDGISSGATAGIVIGCIALVLIVLVVIVFILFKRSADKR